MNYAHIHLFLNHIPILAVPLAALFLGHGLWLKNPASQRFSLGVLFLAALVVLPVYFTGEPAEEVVERLPGVQESFIESHEDMALISLVLSLAAGLSAAVALVSSWRKDKTAHLLAMSALSIALAASASLLYTANLGGKIRHTELRSGGAPEVKSED